MSGDLQEIHIGNIRINPELNLASIDDRDLPLEPKWVQVLLILAKNANEPVKRQSIINEVWDNFYTGEDSLNRAISQLRKVLQKESELEIKTIRGIGYQLVDRSTPADLNPPASTGKRIKWSHKILLAAALLSLALLWFFYFKSDKYEWVKSPVTTQYGIEFDVSISPDNKYLAYSWDEGKVSDYHIYLKEVGKDEAPVKFSDGPTNEASPTWSHDGTKLAYFQTEENGTWSFRVKKLIEKKSRAFFEVDFIPETPSITWGKDDQEVFVSAKIGDSDYDILRYHFATDQLTVFLSGNEENPVQYIAPQFLPENNQLAFLRWDNTFEAYHLRNPSLNCYLTVIGLDSKEKVFEKEFSEEVWDIDWIAKDKLAIVISNSPNSARVEEINTHSGVSKIIYKENSSVKELSINKATSTIYLVKWFADVNIRKVEFSDGEIKENEVFVSSSRLDWSPVLSHAEDKIAFLTDRGGRVEIWLHDLISNTSSKFNKTNLGSYYQSLAWSHNDSLLAANVMSRNKLGYVALLDKNGDVTKEIKLENQSLVYSSWSQDNKLLYVASTDEKQNSVIRKYNLEKETWEKDTIANVTYAKEVGQHLYFTKFGKKGIWISNLDTPELNNKIDSVLFNKRINYFEIQGNKLKYVDAVNYKSYLKITDIDRGITLDSIPFEGTLPITEPGVSFYANDSFLFTSIDNFQADIIAIKQEKVEDQ